MEKVAIFIDGSNFYHALKDRYSRVQIKFDALASALTNRLSNRKLVRVYYYNAAYDQVTQPDAYKRQQRFFSFLRRTPYLSLVLGRLEQRPIDWGNLDDEKRREVEKLLEISLPKYTVVEKGVDVQLAVDMVQLAVSNTYDVAILVSGDGDFAPAVEAVKKLGKHVELGRVEKQPCNRLRDVCDIDVVIDKQMLSDCWV